MALFESGNPTLSQKIFSRNAAELSGEVMTVRGAINKFGFLMFMVIGAAAYTWHLYTQGSYQLMQTLMYVGLFGGLVCAIVISFKPQWANYLAPVYGLLEGLMLGAFSAILNDAFKEKFPNLVMTAVGLTFGVAIAMFLLYNFKIIKPTEKFKSVLISAISGVFFLYLIWFVLMLFKVNVSFMNWNDASPLGIGINIFVIVIAALTLILDFERIETAADSGAPKYMEWYGAFGLLVSIVWLYIQMLKILSRFASRK